jgi:hypothetical protein
MQLFVAIAVEFRCAHVNYKRHLRFHGDVLYSVQLHFICNDFSLPDITTMSCTFSCFC